MFHFYEKYDKIFGIWRRKMMKDINVNLDNIKVAIFDFDDTLAIHKDKEFLKHRAENEETYLNFF